MSKKVKRKAKIPQKDRIKRWERFEYVSKTGVSVTYEPRPDWKTCFTIDDGRGRDVVMTKTQFLGLVDCLNQIVEAEKF